MKVGLLLNSDNNLCYYSEKYREILKKNEILFSIIDPNSSQLINEIKDCSHLLFRHSQGDTDKLLYETIFNIAQNVLGLKCWPNQETFWPYEDKFKEYYLLKSHGFPIVDSYLFWNYNHADSFLKNTRFPLVVKLPKGASSSNVVIIRTIKEGKKIIKQVFNKGVRSHKLDSSSNLSAPLKLGVVKYSKQILKLVLLKTGVLKKWEDYPEWQIQKDRVLFQKFLPGNTFDTRITIIGNRGFGSRRFVRPNDFRASGSGNFDMDPKKVDLRFLEIAFSISKKLNFSTMAYDFIYDENKAPCITEISYCFAGLSIGLCPGYWDDNLKWHDGQTWAQSCQIEDFLNINLK